MRSSKGKYKEEDVLMIRTYTCTSLHIGTTTGMDNLVNKEVPKLSVIVKKYFEMKVSSFMVTSYKHV